MPVSTLDAKSALIAIDLQKGIVSLPVTGPIHQVVERVSTLAEAFRRHGLPIVLVNVAGGAPGRAERAPPSGELPADWMELVPELNPQPQDHRVTKRSWGAFTNTGLEGYLKDLGVTQTVIVGVATSIGVESTARQAYELGFNVALASDAMTDRSAEAHTNSLTRIFPRLGETGTTQEIIDLLDRSRP